MKTFFGQYTRFAVPALLAGSMFATSVLVPSSQTMAQADVKDATVKVQAKPSEIIVSSFGKAMGIEDMLDSQPGDNAKYAKNIESINAVVAFPEKLDDLLQGMGGQKSPVDFYVVVKFNSSEAVEELKEEISSDSDSFEKDGRTHYRPERGEPNFSVTFADDKTLVFATDNYPVDSANLSKVTGNLKSAAVNTVPFNLAADIDGNRDLIDQALGMIKGNPAAAPFVQIPNQMDTLSISIDVDGDPLLVIAGNAKDEATAKKLKTSFVGLVSMGKSAIQAAPAGDSKLDFAKELVGSLKTTTDGTTVKIELPRPEGFEDRVSDLLKE